MYLGNTQEDILEFYFCWIMLTISANEPSAIPETSERWTDGQHQFNFKKVNFTLLNLTYDM